MFRYTKLSLLAVAVATTAAIAYAANVGTSNDALALAQARISLAQAISVAEQHANGKAAHAEYERTRQGWAYDVEIVSADKVFDVRVDATKGTVISSVEDKADHDDDHDEQD